MLLAIFFKGLFKSEIGYIDKLDCCLLSQGSNINTVLELKIYSWRMVQSFHAYVNEGCSLFIGEWLTLKYFMGGLCCVPGGRHPPTSPTNWSRST